MKGYAKLCVVMDKFTRLICMASILLISGIIVTGTFLRFVFKLNLLWSYDWCRVLFMFFVFFAMALVYRMKQHIGFEFMSSKLPKKVARVVNIIFKLAEIGVFAVILFYGSTLAKNSRNQTLPASGLSAMFFYWPIVFAAGICIFFAIEFLLEDLAGFKREGVLVLYTEEGENE